jgi:hypothetical protein
MLRVYTSGASMGWALAPHYLAGTKFDGTKLPGDFVWTGGRAETHAGLSFARFEFYIG